NQSTHSSPSTTSVILTLSTAKGKNPRITKLVILTMSEAEGEESPHWLLPLPLPLPLLLLLYCPSHSRPHQQPAENLIRRNPSTRRQPQPTPLTLCESRIFRILHRIHRPANQPLAKLRPQCLQINPHVHSQPQEQCLLKRLLPPNHL